MIKIIPFASGSSGNLYLLKQDNNNYLIECGVRSDTIRAKLRTQGLLISNIKGCFISHYHSDHSLSCEYVNEYMPIYACNQVLSKFSLEGVRLYHNEKLKLLEMTVLPFRVEHGNADNLGFIFKDKDSTVLFITDCMEFTSNLSKIKFTNIFIECNYIDSLLDEALRSDDEELKSKYVRQCNTHFSLKNLIEHLKHFDLSNCKEMCLLHASKWLIDRKLACQMIYKEFGILPYFADTKLGG